MEKIEVDSFELARKVRTGRGLAHLQIVNSAAICLKNFSYNQDLGFSFLVL